MTTRPSVVLSVGPGESDLLDAEGWIVERVEAGLAALGVDVRDSERLGIPAPPYQGAILPGGAEQRFDVRDLIAGIARAIVADGARVVHVLAEAPPAPANVVVWRLTEQDPPPDFLDMVQGPTADGFRRRAWDAFRGAGDPGLVYVTRPPLGRQAGPAGRPGGDAGPRGDE